MPASLVSLEVPLLFAAWPFDLKGPAFLLLFALASVVSFVIAFGVRRFLLGSDSDVRGPRDLEPLQLALLDGRGRLRYAQAGLAALARSEGSEDGLATRESKFLGLTYGTTQQFTAGELPADASPSLARLHKQLSALGTAKLKDAVTAAVEVAETEERLLQERGLLTSGWSTSPALWGALLVTLPVLATGLVKIGVGIGREKPVGLLILGCLILGLVMLFTLIRKPRRTRAGDALHAEALREYQQFKSWSAEDANGAQPEMLALGIGLFGTGMLAGSELDLLHANWPATSDGSLSGGCGGGCGDGGGCGGGCGGCGGCGG